MYIQNRRDSSKFSGCSPLQISNGLISLKPSIAYFAYTYRWATYKKPTAQTGTFGFCRHAKPTLKNQKSLFLCQRLTKTVQLKNG